MAGYSAAMYLRYADNIREQIEQGAYGPGEELPTEGEIARDFKCSTATVRKALGVLRQEGLISMGRGVRARVRPRPERRALVLRPGERLVGRMPSRTECARLGIDPGVPVLEVERADGSSRLLAANLIAVVGAAI